MRVVFMGTPDFAVPALEALAAAHSVVSVYTQPDRKRGRGSALVASPVKQTALELGIPVRQPSTLADPQEWDVLGNDLPDVICVAAYGMILPAEVLGVPRYGCINLHASLLPEYRGAAPIHRAVLDGADETGVVVMRVEEGLDTGAYCCAYRTPIDDKSVPELEDELAEAGARIILDALQGLEDGTLSWTEQDDDRATYARKITAEDVRLSPDLDVETALRRVRASTRRARAKVDVGGCVLDVTSAIRADSDPGQGAVRAHKDSLVLGFADGAIEIAEVRPQGRACMPGCDWARGARVPDECHWGPA